MGANPEHVCDEHEFSFPEGTNDYCVACGMRKVDHVRFVRLEAEIEDWEASFNLYDDACRRGTKLWQEETGNDKVPRIWPDGAKMVAWLISMLDAAGDREYAENSGRTDAETKLKAIEREREYFYEALTQEGAETVQRVTKLILSKRAAQDKPSD